jgi:diguanylate cyclase (GGDEF)-like protein
MRERSITEKVYLSISLFASLCIFPFALLRWYNGEVTLAIVDGIISLTLLAIFVNMLITRKVGIAKYSIAVFIAFATLTTIIIKGQSQIFWIFPTIMAIHYLVPIKRATFINTALVLSMLFIAFPITNLAEYITIIATSSLTAALSYIMFSAYNNKEHELSKLATIDPLTNTGNRRSLDTKLSEVIANQNREQYRVCLILFDLDNFKDINDAYGHAIGDQILVTVCELVKENTRVLDSLFRYGGDEFLIMPLSMTLIKTKLLAEKIRDIVENYTFVHNVKLTLSMGVSEYKHNDTPESWISCADVQLYKAKHEGRNKVY